MQISLRNKCSTILCCFLICFYYTTNLAQTSETLQEIDTIAFKKSLEEKSFDEVLDIFYANKIEDSLKASLTIKYIKTHFLISENEEQIAESYLTMGAWEYERNNVDIALSNVDKGINIAAKLKDQNLLYQGYQKKGLYFFYRGNNEIKALNNFLKALEIAKETKNIKRQIITTNSIILIKIQVNDNSRAIDLYLENLERIKKANNQILNKQKPKLYLGLSKAYINLDDYEKAYLYCNKGLGISEQMNLIDYQAYFVTFLGEIACNLGEYNKAYNLFLKADELIKKAGGDKSLDTFLKLYLGKTYFFEKKYEKAIVELLKIETLKEKYNIDFLSLQEMYYYLAQSYKEIANLEESLRYYAKAIELDTKNDKIRATINSDIVQKFDLAKLKDEIDALKKNSEKKQYFYYGGATILSGFIIGLVIVNRNQRKKNKRKFKELLQEKTPKENLQPNKSQTKTKGLVPDEKAKEILKKLQSYESNEMYLNTQTTLALVANDIGTNPTYLSKVINKYKNQSFVNYINDLRIAYVVERLKKDKKFRKYKISSIALEAGFKRSEPFSKAFKAKTGLYPSYFIKELNNQIDKDRRNS